ncbi:phosphoribosyltransferase [Paroceanicella profunda]|uniref:phosphoribosyltransferase n=1 Tax=Paroceanicella profunda TaxID=2579971 RepID=UPI001EF022D9|nr:phosphoribosyltransferase [Paroceanicella profunda]
MTEFAPHEFWQHIYAPGHFDTSGDHDGLFPAELPDGHQLALPIRELPGGEGLGVASLIVTQASFAVEEELIAAMAGHASAMGAERIVGVPTLGLPLAHGVARALGHRRYVALGTSRKFWYEERYSEPMSSITSPEQQKRLYVDPRMLPLLAGRRVVVVDDVVSSGRSLAATLRVLARAGCIPVGVTVAMIQTRRWEETVHADWAGPVRAAFETPLLRRTPEGRWRPA